MNCLEEAGDATRPVAIERRSSRRVLTGQSTGNTARGIPGTISRATRGLRRAVHSSVKHANAILHGDLPAYRLVMPPLPATPGHWLVLAADARALADELHDERTKRTMLLIARGYETLARHAARVEALNLPLDRTEVDPSD